MKAYKLNILLVQLILLSVFSLQAQSVHCDPNDITLTSPADDFSTGDVADLGTQKSLFAANTIAAGANITLRAADKILLTDGFFSENESELLGVIDVCTSTSEPNFKSKLHISPNPTTDQLVIFYELEASQKMHIVLMNAIGQNVKNVVLGEEQPSGKYQYEISLLDLPSGIYFLSFQLEDGQYLERIVKVK